MLVMVFSALIFLEMGLSDLLNPMPMVGTIQCICHLMPQPYKASARGPVIAPIIIAGRRISGSRIPPLRRVKVIRHPIGEITTQEDTEEATDNGREETKTRLPCLESIGSVESWCNVRGNSDDETDGH